MKSDSSNRMTDGAQSIDSGVWQCGSNGVLGIREQRFVYWLEAGYGQDQDHWNSRNYNCIGARHLIFADK